LIQLDGKLYRTTYVGAARGCGEVFAIDLKTHAEMVIYSARGTGVIATMASGPWAVCSRSTGSYTAQQAKATAMPAALLYAVGPNTRAETVLHTFSGSDSTSPVGVSFR
jgi:hypothetical protein